MKFLVLGAGVLGRVIGGHLIRAGHEVVFHAREHQVPGLKADGFHLVEVPGERELGVLSAEAVSGAVDASDADFLVVCVRNDQLDEALADVTGAPPCRVIIATPMLTPEDVAARLDHDADVSVLLPGLVAYSEDDLGDSIRYRSGISLVGPLYGSAASGAVAAATSDGVAETFARAGMRTRAIRDVFRVARPTIAGTLPFGLALEAVGFSLAALLMDGRRMRDVAAAATQAIAVAGGASAAMPIASVAARVLRLVPPQLLGLGSFVLPFIPGDLVAAAEQHTRKAAVQTRKLTRDLLSEAPRDAAISLQRLLVEAEQAPGAAPSEE